VSPSLPHRFVLGVAVSLSLAGLVAACGDDDGASSTTTQAPTAGGVSADACDAYTALAGATTGDPSALPGVIATFEQTAPSNLRSAAQKVGETFTAMVTDGDPSVMTDAGYTTAAGKVADAYLAGCDLSAVLDVEGVDYAFEGVPATVKAGRVGIRFTNASTHHEAHEMVLFQRNEGATEPIDQLLALPEDELMSKLTMAGVVFADHPDSQAATMVDLAPGKYVAVCMIPVGGGEDGPPHAMSGMVAEFEAQ
jgi:hypothetical protein